MSNAGSSKRDIINALAETGKPPTSKRGNNEQSASKGKNTASSKKERK